MKLISISPNTLINPEFISCVEQKVSRGIAITYIWVGERSYLLEISLDDFYKSIEDAGETKQIFGG